MRGPCRATACRQFERPASPVGKMGAISPCQKGARYAPMARRNPGQGDIVRERGPNEVDRTDEPGPYVFTEQVGYLLRRAYQRHLAIFQANAGDPQITAVQFSTLCAL